MPAQIRRISKKYLTDAVEITVKNKTTTAANITQRYLQVAHQQKIDALTRILEVENFEGMIVFVRTKQATEVLAERLRARGFEAAAINGDVPQAQRERTINQLRNGRLDILVATDVAARGLDVERISHVVNYDIPTDTESYVHRIGRTGRAGAPATRSRSSPRASVTCSRRSRRPPGRADEDAAADRRGRQRHPGARFTDSITEALASDKLSFYRDLVTDYEQEHDVPAADIAAALAIMAQDGQPLLMEPEPEPQRVFEGKREGKRGAWDHEKGRRRDEEDGRPRRREAGPPRGRSNVTYATYRIAVGKRHKVEPRQIVGAIANEGGLGRSDFGHIDIRGDHSLVELPAGPGR
jgi:ATP-dependent RNA helicase DeaD